MTHRAVQLYAQGWSTRQIGAELGRDHSRIARWLLRAGVESGTWEVAGELDYWLRRTRGVVGRVRGPDGHQT